LHNHATRPFGPHTYGDVDRSYNPTGPQPKSDATVAHDEIATLAHQLWERRGSPIGSPDVDWREAEKQLRGASTKAGSASAQRHSETAHFPAPLPTEAARKNLHLKMKATADDTERVLLALVWQWSRMKKIDPNQITADTIAPNFNTNYTDMATLCMVAATEAALRTTLAFTDVDSIKTFGQLAEHLAKGDDPLKGQTLS
jgi:hypothetical protein